jgi:hypothetical protein
MSQDKGKIAKRPRIAKIIQPANDGTNTPVPDTSVKPAPAL